MNDHDRIREDLRRVYAVHTHEEDRAKAYESVLAALSVLEGQLDDERKRADANLEMMERLKDSLEQAEYELEEATKTEARLHATQVELRGQLADTQEALKAAQWLDLMVGGLLAGSGHALPVREAQDRFREALRGAEGFAEEDNREEGEHDST